MNDSLEQFRDLALRALDDPADAALREELAMQLSAHPAWADEWRALRESHGLAREAAHAAAARAHADRTEEISAARLASLLGDDLARENQIRPTRAHRWRRIGLVAGIALVASTALWIERTFSHDAAVFDPAPWIARSAPTLQRALRAPLAAVVANAQLPTLRADTAVTLRSPLLATQAGEAIIAWTGRETASLVVRESGKVIWSAADTRSPARTIALAPDRVYELVLTPANGPAITENFVTVAAEVPNPTPAVSTLGTVFAALTSEPVRLGEAVLAWHALPGPERHSETGVRIGLWLAVEARQPDLLAEARAAAERLACNP